MLDAVLSTVFNWRIKSARSYNYTDQKFLKKIVAFFIFIDGKDYVFNNIKKYILEY